MGAGPAGAALAVGDGGFGMLGVLLNRANSPAEFDVGIDGRDVAAGGVGGVNDVTVFGTGGLVLEGAN